MIAFSTPLQDPKRQTVFQINEDIFDKELLLLYFVVVISSFWVLTFFRTSPTKSAKGL
jgi:hypothetical protein